MFALLRRNPIIYLAHRMWEFGRDRRRLMIRTVLGSITSTVIFLTTPLVMARFINQAQQAAGRESLIECGLLLAASVLIGVLGWAFHGPSRVTETITSLFIRRNIQVELLSKATKLPIRWHTEHHSGETIDRVGRASAALADFSETSFMVLNLTGRLVGALVMMTIFMPQAAVISIISIGILLLLIVMVDRILVPLYERNNERLNKVASKVQDYLTNITTVISLRLEDRVIGEVSQQLEKLYPLTRRASVVNEIKWFTANLIVDLTRVTVLFWFVFTAVQEERVVALGTLIALNEYLTALGTSFFEFTWKWGDLVIKATKLRAIEEMERDYDLLVGEIPRVDLPVGWRKLHLKGLSFEYEEGTEDSAGVFDLDLTFERGKSYAIVGGSGSGKSTLLSLMRGLSRAQSGCVECDGTVLDQGMLAISRHTTLIPQDPEVFADTVLKNVTMGIDAPQERVLQAIELARFTQVLEELPQGLETNIAEKGISLSGGQKQRLALARGIFFVFDSDSQIILLDESTSSVDVENEHAIFDELLKRFHSELVVATTHKFNLLPLFDEIIVMRNGRVVEQGSLTDLLDANGSFAEMWHRYTSSAIGHRRVLA